VPHEGLRRSATAACSGRFFTIPEAEIRPKPLQQPRPRLLSGMRSSAGLRRTAEKFDIWNPASGPLDQHLEMFGQLSWLRPPGHKPLELYRRLFTTPPVQVANLRPLSVDELCEEVAQSRPAGVDAVIIDTNFDPALDTPQRWAEVLRGPRPPCSRPPRNHRPAPGAHPIADPPFSNDHELVFDYCLIYDRLPVEEFIIFFRTERGPCPRNRFPQTPGRPARTGWTTRPTWPCGLRTPIPATWT
jgi:hypothetical protein